jgi:hypothetical protein
MTAKTMGVVAVLVGVVVSGRLSGAISADLRQAQQDAMTAIPLTESHPLLQGAAMDRYWVERLSFGFTPVFVDVLWMRFLQDDLKLKVPRGVHIPGFYDLELASELDPPNFEAPVFGAMYLSVARDDFSGALELLTRAEAFRRSQLPLYPEEFKKEFWPESWGVPMTLGYVYLFDYQDWDAARLAYEAAAKVPGAPDYIVGLATRMADPEGRKLVARRVLDSLEAQVSRNPELREIIDRKRAEIDRL